MSDISEAARDRVAVERAIRDLRVVTESNSYLERDLMRYIGERNRLKHENERLRKLVILAGTTQGAHPDVLAQAHLFAIEAIEAIDAIEGKHPAQARTRIVSESVGDDGTVNDVGEDQ